MCKVFIIRAFIEATSNREHHGTIIDGTECVRSRLMFYELQYSRKHALTSDSLSSSECDVHV